MRDFSRAILVIVACFISVSVQATECANAGTAPTVAPDDTGDGDATACGRSAVAGGQRATAIGYNASAPGQYANAFGYGTSANGYGALTVGYNATSTMDYGTAIGYVTSVTAAGGVAIGYGAATSGGFGTSMGYQATASNTSSMAIGPFAASSGLRATALGYGAIADQTDTVIVGAELFKVGMGTSNPQVPLHVFRNNGSASIKVEETSGTVAARTLFTLANNGNTKFEINNTNAGNSWAFTNSGSDFRLSLQGSGVVEFRIDNNGDAYVDGMVYANSDRNRKTGIAPVDQEAILEKVSGLPIAHWAYREAPDSQHIGPMAQDFRAAFGTGDLDTKLAAMDVGGVAIAAIQALNAKLESHNRDLEMENAALKRDFESLRSEMAELKALVMQQGPLVARN